MTGPARDIIDGLQVVVVNKKYRDAEGNRYNYRASPMAIAKGWLVERAVLLRKPSGKLVHGHEILMTPKGLAVMERELPVASRKVKGGINDRHINNSTASLF